MFNIKSSIIFNSNIIIHLKGNISFRALPVFAIKKVLISLKLKNKVCTQRKFSQNSLVTFLSKFELLLF